MILIVNHRAGGEEKHELAELSEAFKAAGIEPDIRAVTNGDAIDGMVKKAIASGEKTVVAAGGDGTINAVASALAGTETTLGVLPKGTLNHFAKDAGIPLDLKNAVAVIADAHTKMVDVGEVNGRLFLNNASLGLYPRMVHKRDRDRQRLKRGKWPAMFWAMLNVLRRHPYFDLTFEIDGRKIARRTTLVFIGNNEYQMDLFNIGTRAELDAGKISIYILREHRSRFGLLKVGFKALLGMLSEQRDFEKFMATEMKVESRHRLLRLATDGEISKMSPPLIFRTHPRSLRVLVPRPEPAT